MPQRITQTAAQAAQVLDVNGRSLLASHDPITSILRSRLGQAHGDLLATPKREADGAVTWSTPLAGEAKPAQELPEDERAKLQRRADQLLGDIRGLAERMRQESATGQVVAQMLDCAATRPEGDWLYSVGGKPVLVMWGHGAPPATSAAATGAAAGTSGAATATATAAPGLPPSPAASPAPKAGLGAGPGSGAGSSTGAFDPAAAAMADLAGGGPAPPGPGGAAVARGQDDARGGRRWLLALVALGLLAALAFFALRGCDALAPGANEGPDPRLAQAEADNRALEAELARRRGESPQFICARPPEPPVAAASEPPPPEPTPEPPPPPASEPASAPEPAASAPEPPQPPASPVEPPKRDPLEPLRQRIAKAGKDCGALQAALQDPLLRGRQPEAAALRQELGQRYQQQCREQAIREAKNLCPGQRPKELAPELALVFDASGSMGYSLDLNPNGLPANPADVVEGLLRQLGGPLGGLAAGGLDRSRLTREPTRMTAAKRAAISTVQRAPSDANIGLVRIEGGSCSARSAGFYPPARRGQLIGELQGMEARGGTPLADGVAKGGQMVDGVSREALMVVISDGAESCGRDPCAVARDLKRAKPHLKINVVDITGTGAANCLAAVTGGRVFTARNADEVATMTREASQDALGPANCPR